MVLWHSASARRAFTLIELLVVIAIIGLLSSVVFASLNSARAKARAARVKSDFQQIERAAWLDSSDRGGKWAPDVRSGASPAFVPKYLSQWPKPPCDGWKYDWENWSSNKDIRVSLRKQNGHAVAQRCIYQDGVSCTNTSFTQITCRE